jgi:outer membrane receptor protein involved in Fe transport
MLPHHQRRSLRATAALACALCASLPPLARADDYETVVAASRADDASFEAPMAVESIDSEEMDHAQARTLPDAVENASGVAMQRTNRGAGAPIIRGLIGPQNLILVDGVRYNTSTFRTGPNQYLSTFDLHAIDRVEVIRGPSSVLHGDGAMGGVLRLVTEDPASRSPGWHSRASTFLGGADASTGGALAVSHTGDGLSSLAGGSFQSFSDLVAGGGLRQPHSDFRTAGWRARLSFRPPSVPLSVSGAYFGAIVSDAGRTDEAGWGDLRFYDNEDHLAYLSVSGKGPYALEEVRGTISYHRMVERVDRFGCQTGADDRVIDLAGCLSLAEDRLDRKRRYRDVVDAIGGNLNAVLTPFSRRLRLDLGLEAYLDRVGSALSDARASEGFAFEPAQRGNFSDGSRYRTFGLYAHADLLVRDLGPVGALRASAGGRFSSFGAHAPAVPGIGDVEYSHGGFAGSGGLQLVRPDLFNLWASFTQGFRAPNLQETTVLGDTGSKFEIPNDDLRPERSNTIEAGSRVSLSPLSLEAVWFRSYLVDAIDEEPAEWEGQAEIDGSPVVRRVNTARGLYQGLEGSASLEIWRFTLSGGAAWIEGELADGGDTHPARRIPPLFGTASLVYEQPARALDAGLYARWAARQDRLHPSDEEDARICEAGMHTGLLRSPCDGTPGWYSLDLRGGLRPTDTLRIEMALENLTDRRYKTHGSGYYQPGLSASVTMILEL